MSTTPRPRKVTIERDEGGRWANEEVMARAKKLFPGTKPRKSGAGDYSPTQLMAVYESLKKEG